MPYTPPNGGTLTLPFSSSAVYTPPPGGALVLEFSPPAGTTVFSASLGETLVIGTPALAWSQFVNLDSPHNGIASEEEFSTSISVEYPLHSPPGIASTLTFGNTTITLFQQFVSVPSVPEYLWHNNDNRIRDADLTYLDNLPDGGAIEMVFTSPYSVPGGGTLVLEFNPGSPRLRPSSIGITETFGTHTVYNLTQYVTNVGNYNAFTGLGNITVYNLTQYLVDIGGISSTVSFGTATAYNLTQYVSYVGNIASSLGFGTTLVYNLNRTLYDVGSIYSTLVFGDANVINRNRTMYPTGLASSLTMGQQFVWNWSKELSVPSLGVMTSYGTTSLVNLTRLIYPQRIDPKGVGTPSVENWIRYVFPSGVNMSLYGTHSLIGPRYLKPKWTTEKWLHEHKVEYFNRTLYPSGFGLVATNVGFDTDIRNRNRYILPDGIAEPERFEPIVYNPPTDIIWVDGDINTSFVTDEADIYNSTRNKIILRAAISNGATFGTPRMSPMYLNMSGKSKDMIAWGKPRVENHTRYVEQKQAGNFVRFGTAWVSFYVREVAPYGIDESCVFYEYPAPDPTTGKLPGVYPQAVTIYPESFEGSGVTYDNCGFPRTPQIPRPSVHP